MSWQCLCYSNEQIEDFSDFNGKYSDAINYFSIVVSMLNSVIGLIGNGFVIFFTIFITKKQNSKIWFLNLAITDFTALILLPFHGISAFLGYWPYGPYMCKISMFLICLNMYASIFILMALNISRVLSVAKPIFYLKFISKRFTRCTCAGIWIITILASMPVLYFSGEFQIGEDRYCSIFCDKDISGDGLSSPGYNKSENISSDFKYNGFTSLFTKCSSELCCGDDDTLAAWNRMVFSLQCFVIPLLLIGYFLPLTVITFCNITIALQARKSPSVDTSRLYRIVITIIVLYFVTWTPWTVVQINLLNAIRNMNAIQVFKMLMLTPCTCTIASVNFCLDPILYVLVGRQTRTGLASFLISECSNSKITPKV